MIREIIVTKLVCVTFFWDHKSNIMKAIVISETYNRFERTKQVLSSVNITEVIHSPAIFVPNTPNCSGINGHRLAFRNAWNTIKVTNTPMLILEDDVVIDIRTHIPRHMNTDLHYFGWCGSGYCATTLRIHR